MITEVPIVQEVQEAPVVVQDDNAGIPEVNEVASAEANQGTDTSRSASLNNSIHSSDNV